MCRGLVTQNRSDLPFYMLSFSFFMSYVASRVFWTATERVLIPASRSCRPHRASFLSTRAFWSVTPRDLSVSHKNLALSARYNREDCVFTRPVCSVEPRDPFFEWFLWVFLVFWCAQCLPRLVYRSVELCWVSLQSFFLLFYWILSHFLRVFVGKFFLASLSILSLSLHWIS